MQELRRVRSGIQSEQVQIHTNYSVINFVYYVIYINKTIAFNSIIDAIWPYLYWLCIVFQEGMVTMHDLLDAQWVYDNYKDGKCLFVSQNPFCLVVK